MHRLGRCSRSALASVVVLAACVALGACGDSSGGSTATTADGGSPTSTSGAADFSKYHMTYANGAATGVVATIRDSVVRDAKRLGVHLTTFENNADGPTALTNADLMIQDQPDMIIEYNLVDGVGPALGKKLTSSGIPCMSVNVQTPGCPLINLSNRFAGEGAGEIIADHAIKEGWTADDTTVLVVQCSTCGVEINDSVRYFYLTVAKKMGMPVYPPSRITAQTTTLGPNLYQVDDPDISIDKAYSAVQAALQSIPKSRHLLVFAVSDDVSIGAWRAVAAANRQDDTLIGGLSGLPEGLNQLRTNPRWVAEGSAFTEHWGQYVMAMAVSLLNGAKAPALTPFPQVTMDKTTVSKYYPDGATVAKLLPKLVADNRYLAKSGVLQVFDNVEGLEG